jgi:hypothetical protein
MESFMPSYNTCRLCKKSTYESPENLVKYAVRHHAHLSCALTKWGEAFFDRLHPHQLGQPSFMTLMEHNLLETVKLRLEQRTASQKKESHG